MVLGPAAGEAAAASVADGDVLLGLFAQLAAARTVATLRHMLEVAGAARGVRS